MMESAETGACMWMVTSEKMFGIRIEKLEKLGKNDVRDWKSHLEPAPFDFRLDLPGAAFMCPFIFDSKLFFGGGEFDSCNKIHQISDVGGYTLGKSEEALEMGVIPPLPTRIYESYIANIQGDVYLVVLDDAREGREAGLWVLRSRSWTWHSLSAPPTTRDSPRPSWPAGFVLKDKLILHPLSQSGSPCVYDPQTDMWHKLKGKSSVADYLSRGLAFVSSLRHKGNCSVVLTWKAISCPTDFVKYEIHALLVDNQNYSVLRRQCLGELCKALQPSFNASSTGVNMIDLGNSKVCVIICGIAENIPALCIVVVELGLLQEEEQRLDQRFLSVRVLGNQIYDMLPHIKNRDPFWVSTSFIFSLSKGMPRKHPYSQDCISPRKVPKPAGGTNPSNPTTAFEQE